MGPEVIVTLISTYYSLCKRAEPTNVQAVDDWLSRNVAHATGYKQTAGSEHPRPHAEFQTLFSLKKNSPLTTLVLLKPTSNFREPPDPPGSLSVRLSTWSPGISLNRPSVLHQEPPLERPQRNSSPDSHPFPEPTLFYKPSPLLHKDIWGLDPIHQHFDSDINTSWFTNALCEELLVTLFIACFDFPVFDSLALLFWPLPVSCLAWLLIGLSYGPSTTILQHSVFDLLLVFAFCYTCICSDLLNSLNIGDCCKECCVPGELYLASCQRSSNVGSSNVIFLMTECISHV